jgi:hypothetical protein
MADSQLENSCMRTHRQSVTVIGACALAAVLAACGSSGPSHPSTPATTPSANNTTSSSASAATSAIKANWTTFFDFKTATSKQVALLENGSDFTGAINTMKGNPIASGAHAQVLSVTNVTPSTATVKYNVLLGTAVALPNQTGQAVYQDGTWKVGDSSLCGLLKLGLAKSQVPAACSSAG